jgi:hypothetical protein
LPHAAGGFLGEMERIVPWSGLCALIEPFYPKPGNGRPPIGIERMLRLYFLQQWFNRHCQVGRFGRAAACEHDDIAEPLSRLPVPARGHRARGLALSLLQPELARR